MDNLTNALLVCGPASLSTLPYAARGDDRWSKSKLQHQYTVNKTLYKTLQQIIIRIYYNSLPLHIALQPVS